MGQVLVAIAIFLFTFDARAQSLPSNAEATALLRKAIEATDLRATSAPPFHLIASFHYVSEGKSSDGKYELLWAAPDRYRVNFVLGSIDETDIVLADKIFIARSTPTLTFPKWVVEPFLWFPVNQLEDKAATRVFSTQIDGKMQTCLDAGSDKYAERRACLDPATNDLMSVTVRATAVKGNGKFQLELSDFVSVGTLHYPKHILLRNAIWSVSAEVEKFVETVDFDPNVFVPPANVITRGWCPKLADKDQTSQTTPSRFSAPRPFPEVSGYTAWYFLVSPEGNVTNSVLLHSSGLSLPTKLDSGILGTRRRIHSCDGKPIEYETVMWIADIVKH